MLGYESAIPNLHFSGTLELSMSSNVFYVVLLQITVVDAIQTFNIGITGLLDCTELIKCTHRDIIVQLLIEV